MNNNIIEATELYKRFKKPALINLSIMVKENTIYGVLGPNGAGKTTLISILSGILKPDKGEVKIFQMDLEKNERYIKSMINICSGYPNFIWSMSVYENLNCFGMLYGINYKRRKQTIEYLVEVLELKDYLNFRFNSLSTGLKQRLALAKSLINEPKLLFLDEPTVGLDPDIAIKIREFIKTIHRERNITMVLTTHNMQEAEKLCDRICFLKEGKKIIEAAPAELKNIIEYKNKIEIALEFAAKNFEFLKDIEGITSFTLTDNSLSLNVDNLYRLNTILSEFNKRNILINDIKVDEVDLEDVFLSLTRK